MDQSASLLNLVLFLPMVGAIVMAFMPREQHGWHKATALGTASLTLLLSIFLAMDFRTTSSDLFQAVTAVPWIKQFGIQYKVGIDGISLCLIVLTTFLSVLAIASSFEAIQDKQKEYYIFLLLLETGMLGTLAALDLMLFYVFWEAMLIPMYFLIGIWGGPRKLYATIKFVLYTLVGSLLMLVAIVWVYVATVQSGQGGTFDLERLLGPNSPWQTSALGGNIRFWLFMAFASAFAIKVPMWPFHTWLPDAHVEAPTAGSVILAGVMLKMGTYGFIRFCIPLFPEVALQVAPWMLGLSVIGIIYGALVAYVQKDVKRLVAYSSVSHLGFCMLGLFAFTPEAVVGSVLQMINHGLSTGALFLIVGMLYERRHTREIAAFGGLWKAIPVFSVFFLISMLSSVGLPGLNGFVGEFLILLGTWRSCTWACTLAATGVILGAVYLLWMFQRVMQGPLDRPENQRLQDLTPREFMILLPLVIAMFWIGIAPNALIGVFNEAVNRTVVAPIQAERARANAGAMFSQPGGAPPGAPGAPTAPTPGSPMAPPTAPGAPTAPTGGAPAHGPDDGHGHPPAGAPTQTPAAPQGH